MDFTLIVLIILAVLGFIRLFGLFIQWLGLFASDQQSEYLDSVEKDLTSKGL